MFKIIFLTVIGTGLFLASIFNVSTDAFFSQKKDDLLKSKSHWFQQIDGSSKATKPR